MTQHFNITDNTVYVLYTCDAWRTYGSRNMEAICSSMEQVFVFVEEIAKEIKEELTEYDYECLKMYSQTQGHSTNFSIDAICLNEKLC